jgi:hypothetical protein
MTEAHKGTILPIKNRVLAADENTAFLAHYDLNEHDVLHGTKPIGYSSVINFDATNSYIEVPNHSSLDIQTNLTLEAWVYLKGAPVAGDRATVMIYSGAWYLTVDNAQKVSVHWYGKVTPGYHVAPTVLSLNTWYHISAVWDATMLKIYINGNLDFSVGCTGLGNISSGRKILDIGAEGKVSRKANAKFRDLRVWDKALAQDEIKNNMYENLTGKETGLCGWWKLNDQETVARDSSQFQNDGLIANPQRTTGDSVFTLRPKEGVFGGTAIAIEEVTTNLIVNPSFLTTNNWGFATSGTGTLSTDGRWAKMGVTNGETNVYHFAYQDIARVTPANKPIAFSVTFKNNTSGRFALRLVMFEATAAVQQPMTEVVLDGTGIPKRYTVVGVHTANSSSLRFDILSGSYYSSYGGLSDVDLEFNDLQAEEKAFPTSFVNGERPTGLLRYPNPIYGAGEGTINFWAKFPDTRSILTSQVWFWDYDGTTVTEWFGISNSGGAYKLTNFGNLDASIYQDSWHMYTIVKDLGNTLRTYIDGGLVMTKTGSAVTNMFKSSTNISLGSHSNGSYPANILIDEVRIDKVARTEEEILAWYQSNSPFWPRGMHRKSY